MRRFEFVDGKSNKFWEAKAEGPKLMVRFGRIGGTWQESDKLLADAEKANAEMEKLIREKTRKGYLEVGGKPEVKVLAKAVAKKAKTKEPKPESMEATISPAERKAKAQKVLLMFANGQWELAHSILETAQDEEWLFEQLLNGCKIEDGKPIPSNAIKKAFKKEEKSSPVLAMLNIMLCNPSSSKALKSFKFEKLKERLWLHDLTSLSDGVAEALSKQKGDLNLSDLTSLTDSPGHIALAGKLASNKGQLDLAYLTSLSDGAAEALSKYKGPLFFYRLANLSDAAAEALSKHKGDLYLGGLESLSDTIAKSLSKHEGGLSLNVLTSLSDCAAESLSKHKGELNLWGLKTLSDCAAESLSKHKGGLNLSGLTSLSDCAAESLSKHKGDLHLWNLKISKKLENSKCSPGYVALALSLIRNGISLGQNGFWDSNKGGWYLGDSPAQIDLAKSISMHKGYLKLNELTYLSDAAAEFLSKHKGGVSLGGLTHLRYTAEALSKYKGDLGLDGLTYLTDAEAESLSKHKGELNLNGLTSLTATAAKALSKHEGDLELRGLKSLSNAAAEALSKHNGNLCLSNSLEEKVEKYKNQGRKK